MPRDPNAAGTDPGSSRKGIRERTAELASRADTARRTAERKAETLRQRHAAVRLAFDTYERERRHAGALLAGGLAYRLSVAPPALTRRREHGWGDRGSVVPNAAGRGGTDPVWRSQ
jgi:hypothetical protein